MSIDTDWIDSLFRFVIERTEQMNEWLNERNYFVDFVESARFSRSVYTLEHIRIWMMIWIGSKCGLTGNVYNRKCK